MTKNLKKFTAVKHFKIFFGFFGEAFSPQKRTSSTKNMKILYFFLYLWVIFALLDPDTDPATP
jgi:hypothetical protein